MFSGAVETGQKHFILRGVEVEMGAEAEAAGSVEWELLGGRGLYLLHLFSHGNRKHLRNELGEAMGEGLGM